MPSYKVLKSYYDVPTKKQLVVGEVVELSKDRADFIVNHLETFGGGFLEEIKTEKKVRSKKTLEESEE